MALGQAFVPDTAPGGSAPDVYDEGVLETSAASKFNFTGAGVTATDDGAGGTDIDIPGGGSEDSKVFPWDTLPASPSALDDAFDGTTLDAKWTAIGGAGLTNTVKNGWLFMETTATGASFNLRGIEQVLPAGNFSVITPLRQLGLGQYSISGVHVRNATTGALLRINLFNNANTLGNSWVGSARYSSLTNRTATMNESITSPSGMTYELALRISYDGTNIVTAISLDGLNWYDNTSEAIGTTFGAGVPNRVGLAIDAFSATLPGRAGFRAFRYVASANAGIGAFA